MSRIGILAYGSLIQEPGEEIGPVIRERKERIETPFRVEFARSSSTRDGAPTLVPVECGGGRVQATILVLDACVNLGEAQDLLWRRETRNECTGKHYTPPSKHNPNGMVVEKLDDFAGLNVTAGRPTAYEREAAENEGREILAGGLSACPCRSGREECGLPLLTCLVAEAILCARRPWTPPRVMRKPYKIPGGALVVIKSLVLLALGGLTGGVLYGRTHDINVTGTIQHLLSVRDLSVGGHRHLGEFL